ncbi:MAG: hypothetical protein ACTH5D_05110 [Halomonas sp.]|uniref:hypothetical protein n=1 Tax=Halomonas sp. TaxID=1486246 RepID=UPI003F8DA3BB
MAMTGAEYDALVKLMRGSPESAANRAARGVLVEGMSQTDARRETGATRSTVSDAVARYEEADRLIRVAYRVKRSGELELERTPLEAYHDLVKTTLEEKRVMSYAQISPATNWYFRHENSPHDERPCTVYQVAAWALTEEGEVVGLVTVRDPETKRAKLVTPPPLPGDYLHQDQLSAEESEYAKLR